MVNHAGPDMVYGTLRWLWLSFPTGPRAGPRDESDEPLRRARASPTAQQRHRCRVADPQSSAASPGPGPAAWRPGAAAACGRHRRPRLGRHRPCPVRDPPQPRCRDRAASYESRRCGAGDSGQPHRCRQRRGAPGRDGAPAPRLAEPRPGDAGEPATPAGDVEPAGQGQRAGDPAFRLCPFPDADGLVESGRAGGARLPQGLAL